ncbi:hypothetical protein [Crocosphaera sp.]|uniref:hypothetical protein n=1 Tax=Crocosphaera sp. TaxID=2729996 RepID=UPI003F21831B|nr:hypothetical protein [Crocosphaera sp.]
MNSKDYITKSTKNSEVKSLINEALLILDQLGIPLKNQTTRRLERLGMAFLAVTNIKNSQDWKNIKTTSQNHSFLVESDPELQAIHKIKWNEILDQLET